jgi:hypothetical protein
MGTISNKPKLDATTPKSSVMETATPKVAQPAPTSTLSNFTLDDLVDEDFSFLDPFLGVDVVTPAPVVEQCEAAKLPVDPPANKPEDRPVETPATNYRRAPRKEMPEAKRKRRESASSSSSSSSSSGEDTDSEDEKSKTQEDGFNQEILGELRRSNQQLSQMYTCLMEMKGIMGRIADTLEQGERRTDRNKPDRESRGVEEHQEERRSSGRSEQRQSGGWQTRRWQNRSPRKSHWRRK